jgi:hypothetical protein
LLKEVLAWSISWLLRGSRPVGWNRKYGRLTPVIYIYIYIYISRNFHINGKWTIWTITIAQIVFWRVNV